MRCFASAVVSGVAAACIAALFIAGLFGSPGATSADDWDMKINGGVAQLLP
jgi:hypothetical protein